MIGLWIWVGVTLAILSLVFEFVARLVWALLKPAAVLALIAGTLFLLGYTQ
jgi:hypothetical protein